MTITPTRAAIIMTAILLAMTCCGRHRAAWSEMDLADSLMETAPDSALCILDSIDPGSLGGREEKARYALLMSMAMDKNYIDTTDFKVLQPAIDYYPEHGTPDERLRTYYYQGVIHLNRKEDEAAMQSLMKAVDQHAEATDSLTLARAYVAEGTLFYNEYKIRDYVKCNLAAADLYLGKGKTLLAIKRYTNALDGYILTSNREKADSMLAICRPLVERNHDGEKFLTPSIMSYTLEFGTPEEIRECLDRYLEKDLTTEETVDLARGFLQIGEADRAMQLINSVVPGTNILDTLKYDLNKIDILDSLGRYKEAYLLFREYAVLNDGYHNELFTNDLLHADKRHQLEIDSLNSLRKKDRTIWAVLCGVFALTMIALWLYYLGYRQKTRRRLAEQENENLRLREETLRKNKEKAEAEKIQAQLERDKEMLEAEALRRDISDLEAERDRLKEVERKHTELSQSVRDVIRIRLDVLNSLLAKEIADNDDYAKPYRDWIKTLRKDKKKFMDTTSEAFTVSHPRFMEYLHEHGLTQTEINYLCMYAIGLRGKEIGDYIELKRHYVMGSVIRSKLGIDKHETNLGPYVRQLLNELG